ncbi:hypothetical protein JCM15765_45700 [Paradesulfitobacterium aromaticivorans]
MEIENIKNICVVGAGNMGRQIALCAALAGYIVTCIDVSQEMLDKANEFVQAYLTERVAKGKLSEQEASLAQINLSFTPYLSDAAVNADFVIEAVLEKLDVKRQLFAELDRICPSHTILATNSSTFVSSKLADATGRPAKICNMHFFNPALVMNLVEVVQGPHTSENTVRVAEEVCTKLGKKAILLRKEIYGLLVNRLLNALQQEALFLAEVGIASPADIDIAVVNALGHPMGPFRLMDLIGLDVLYYAAAEKYQDSLDPKDKPSPLLVEKYARGEWGKKIGKGFYSYE